MIALSQGRSMLFGSRKQNGADDLYSLLCPPSEECGDLEWLNLIAATVLDPFFELSNPQPYSVWIP